MFGNKEPRSPYEWFDLGCSLRQNARFGEAMNAFREAAVSAGDLLGSAVLTDEERLSLCQLRDKASASIELIKDINGFVNTDLMNP